MDEVIETEINQIEGDIAEYKSEIKEIKKALTIVKATIVMVATPEFKLVIRDNFIKAYRETANVNIGLVRHESVPAIATGLVGRAQLEAYLNDLVNSEGALQLKLDQYKDGLQQAEEALIEEKKLEQEPEEVEG